MTYRTEPYQAAHFHKLIPQYEQREDLSRLNVSDWTPELMEGLPHSLSAFRDDVLLGFAQAALIWPGRAQMNLFLSTDVGRIDMLFLTRTLINYLNMLQCDHRYQRCECSVLEGFEPGHRWMLMLGFQSEGVMRRYDVSGRDHRLYARIRS